MNITFEKNELIKWIQSIENPLLIEEIKKIKQAKNFDFEKDWQRSISGEELKRRAKQQIDSWDWKR